MIAPDWTLPIRVTEHALRRHLERLGSAVGRDEVVAEVRQALLFDRFADTKPDWTRRGHARTDAKPGRLFAWDEEPTRCWALHADDDRVVVCTVFAESGHAAKLASLRHLRGGRPDAALR